MALLAIGLVAVGDGDVAGADADFPRPGAVRGGVGVRARSGCRPGSPPTSRRARRWWSRADVRRSNRPGHARVAGWRCANVRAVTDFPRRGPSLARYKDPRRRDRPAAGSGRRSPLELARGGTEVLAVDSRSDGRAAAVGPAQPRRRRRLDRRGGAAGDRPRRLSRRRSSPSATTSRPASLTTALLAEFGVPDIWVKATSRQQATILERIGAHHVVFPESDMGERIAHLVSGRLLDWVELDAEWVFAKTRPPREIVGVPPRGDRPAQEAPRHRGVGQAREPGQVHPRRRTTPCSPTGASS